MRRRGDKITHAQNLRVGVNKVNFSRRHDNTSRRQPLHGFTLVELLVVIAIIALLLSILMPSLGKVRKQAQSVVCRTNLKQWGLAWMLYAQDNNGSFFHGLDGPPYTDVWDDYWYMKLYKYVKVQQILLCPSAKHAPSGTPNWSVGNTITPWGPSGFLDNESGRVIKDAFGSYGVNAWIHNPREGQNPYGRKNENFWKRVDVSGSSNVPIVLDCIWNGTYPDDPASDFYQRPRNDEAIRSSDLQNYAYTTNAFCINRHNGTVNGVFLDGSGRPVGLKGLWSLKWHRAYDTTRSYPKKWPTWMSTFK